MDQACHSSWTAVTKTEALWAEKVNLYLNQVNTGYSKLEGAARGQPAAKWMIGVSIAGRWDRGSGSLISLDNWEAFLLGPVEPPSLPPRPQVCVVLVLRLGWLMRKDGCHRLAEWGFASSVEAIDMQCKTPHTLPITEYSSTCR